MTWSNDLCYQQFDFSEFDWVVTNPPFSLMSDFLNRIADAGCGGLIIAPLVSLSSNGGERLLRAGWHAYDEGRPESFMRPDGSVVSQIGLVVLLTHRADWIHTGTKKRYAGPRRPPEDTMEGIPRYSRVCDVPDTWEGEIAVPLSFACVKYDPSIHDIVCHNALHRIDGSNFFKSWIVKIKE